MSQAPPPGPGAPSPDAPTSTPAVPSRNWWLRNWKWVVPVGCLLPVVVCCGGITLLFSLVFGAIKSSEPYKQSLAMVQTHPQVTAALGTPIEPGFFLSGNINVSGGSGEADLNYPISGPHGDASVFVIAERSAGLWTLTTVDVVIHQSGERISLTSPPPP